MIIMVIKIYQSNESQGNEHEIQVRWSKISIFILQTLEVFGKDIEKSL